MLQADAAGSGRDEEEFERRGELEGSEVGALQYSAKGASQVW